MAPASRVSRSLDPFPRPLPDDTRDFLARDDESLALELGAKLSVQLLTLLLERGLGAAGRSRASWALRGIIRRFDGARPPGDADLVDRVANGRQIGMGSSGSCRSRQATRKSLAFDPRDP